MKQYARQFITWAIHVSGLSDEYVHVDEPIEIERDINSYTTTVRTMVHDLLTREYTFAEKLSLAAQNAKLPSKIEDGKCPRCDSDLFFSRLNAQGVAYAGDYGDMKPAPICESCGYNGRFTQFGSIYEALLETLPLSEQRKIMQTMAFPNVYQDTDGQYRLVLVEDKDDSLPAIDVALSV